MATEQIRNLGQGGVIKDVPPMLLPENILTDARNVRFNNKSIRSILGESVYRTVTTFVPKQAIHWQRPDQGYDIYLSDNLGVRKDAAGNEAYVMNLVGAQYTNSKWDPITFNGGYAIVINNGKSTPLYMLYGNPTAGTTFQELPGWNYIAGLSVTAKVVRQLGYSLVAANLTLTEGATVTYAPSTIRISTQAATGAIPNTWLPGTTTDTADEFEINNTSPILDMAELRGNMYVYSSSNIHVLSINTGTSRVQPYAQGYGILTTGCVAEFEGQHFVVDKNDIYTHSGSGGIKSIAEDRIKNYFFANLNKAHYDKTFVKKNGLYKEIWVYYPKGTSTVCNEVLIYNYASDTWTIRDAANVLSGFIGPGLVSGAYNYSEENIYNIVSASSTVLQMDVGNSLWNPTAAGLQPMTSYIVREKLNSGDTLGSNIITALTPMFDQVPVDASMSITVTGQNNYTKAADFTNTSGRDTFLIEPQEDAQGYKVDPRVSGRVLNYKISGVAPWRLGVIGLEVVPHSRR